MSSTDSTAPAKQTDLTRLTEQLPDHARARLATVHSLLQRLEADHDCNIAAVALTLDRHQVKRSPLNESQEALVAQLRSILTLEEENAASAIGRSAENLRRLLMAIISDVRVVLVVLSRALARLRESANADEALQSELGQTVRDVYAPLANRLGIWQLKWELEDWSFRFLEPRQYRAIAKQLDEKRTDRERYMTDVVARMQTMLRDDGIDADVNGRPKHIYSIYKKMRAKDLAFEELFDIRAVRILVDEVASCYAALGLVHAAWKPIPKEFDDYIANPKPNGYQSLHTAVFGPEGRTVEVQIRTHEMHRDAELGVAAHWQYKEAGKTTDSRLAERINLMRSALESGEQSAQMFAELADENEQTRIYVLTPRGEVVDLPSGATPLDFAYQVHTEVGHRCRGAKVNGRITTLTTPLANGQRVEIITAKTGEPSRDWMNPDAGYLRSSRARQKVRQWFKALDFDRNVESGREWIERELKRTHLEAVDLAALLTGFNLDKLDNLFVAVATGEIGIGQVLRAAERQLSPAEKIAPTLRTPKRRAKGTAIDVAGVDNLLTEFAKCCNPVPGEAIIGYISASKGIVIHRQDCENIERVRREGDTARLIEVNWADASSEREVSLTVLARPRRRLLKDITDILSTEHCELSAIDGEDREGQSSVSLTVFVRSAEQLSKIINRLNSLAGVDQVIRRA